MKKIYYISLFLIIVIVSYLGITYSYEYDTDESISFELIGPSVLYIDANSEYTEYGIKVFENGNNVSKKVKIDASMVDTSRLGEYYVRYEYGNEYVTRKVVVIDKVKPVINLIGGNQLFILIDGNYEDAGYTAEDDIDGDLTNKVEMEGSVDTRTEGVYTITYSVKDNSGNVGIARRIVTVKNDVSINSKTSFTSYNTYSNSVVKNQFTDAGIYYQVYIRNSNGKHKMVIKNKDTGKEYTYDMDASSNNSYYVSNVKLSTIKNGTYDIYVDNERLINKLDVYSRIIRAKVGQKLVTMNYDNGYVSINVDSFKYEYDVAIDPGHGGYDTGAANYSNGTVKEKDLNLKVSKYEKCRYESMGYRVYMVRYDDTYGEMLGDNSMDDLDRRAFALGYYGSVSRVMYSNHHNGSTSKKERGFEIIVSNQITAKELKPELALYKRFSEFYDLKNDRVRMYSKNYYTSEIFNKANGAVNKNTNFYAVIRIPYELYNVKNVIYEPIFLDNNSDFRWYVTNDNWVNISEMKIKEYVKYMGGIYNSDNKMCL